MWCGCGEEVGEQVGQRYALGAGGVDEFGVDAVAGGEEAVLGECFLGVCEVGWGVAFFEFQSADGLHERAQGGGCLQSWLGVHDAYFDGAEAGLWSRVPPEEGWFGDRFAAQEQVDGGDPVVVVLEVSR